MARPSKKTDSILCAADSLFTARGYTRVSMDDIAAAAPVSKATLYARFKDKAALFSAVVTAKCAALTLPLETGISDTDPPAAALRRFGMLYLEKSLSDESIKLIGLMAGTNGDFPEVTRNYYKSGLERVEKIMASYLRAQHKRKTLRVADPDLAAEMFHGLLRGNNHFRCLFGHMPRRNKKDLKKMVDYAVDMFMATHAA
jgi:TetR/AcrR family transcriptional regulator, mexJK operon transcriptional repressor